MGLADMPQIHYPLFSCDALIKCVYTHKHMHTHSCTHTHTHTTHVHTLTHARTHTHTHTHTQTHAYVHTHTHNTAHATELTYHQFKINDHTHYESINLYLKPME